MEKVFRAKSTLEQWRILQAVVDVGSYAKAAEKLNKSQSSLNHAVAKLQNQLGIDLLEVIGRRTYLTPAGEIMLRRSRQVLTDIEELEHLADTLNKGWEPEIKVAVEVLYPRTILFDILKNFLPQSRNSRLKISNEVISGSAEAIRNKSADIVITNIIPAGHIGNTLCHIELIPVCGVKHSLNTEQPINIEQLAEHLQLVISETGDSKNNTGWLKAEQRWTLDTFQDAVEVMKTGIGFCWLPQWLAEQAIKEKTLKRIKLNHYSSRSVAMQLVIPDRDNLGPGGKTLEQLFYQQHKIMVYETNPPFNLNNLSSV
jgi:DNA-binding transcriptional LysR family regulator